MSRPVATSENTPAGPPHDAISRFVRIFLHSNLSAILILFASMTGVAALLVTPFVFDASMLQLIASIVCGVALMLLSLPRGSVRERYATWNRYIL